MSKGFIYITSITFTETAHYERFIQSTFEYTSIWISFKATIIDTVEANRQVKHSLGL